jgi:hypothetical protein
MVDNKPEESREASTDQMQSRGVLGELSCPVKVIPIPFYGTRGMASFGKLDLRPSSKKERKPINAKQPSIMIFPFSASLHAISAETKADLIFLVWHSQVGGLGFKG